MFKVTYRLCSFKELKKMILKKSADDQKDCPVGKELIYQ